MPSVSERFFGLFLSQFNTYGRARKAEHLQNLDDKIESWYPFTELANMSEPGIKASTRSQDKHVLHGRWTGLEFLNNGTVFVGHQVQQSSWSISSSQWLGSEASKQLTGFSVKAIKQWSAKLVMHLQGFTLCGKEIQINLSV